MARPLHCPARRPPGEHERPDQTILADLGQATVPVFLFVIRSKSGRSIENLQRPVLPSDDSEGEVLFLPNTQFHVRMVFPQPDGSKLIFLDEV